MAFEQPPPDLAKLLTAWEEWEKGELPPARCWPTSRRPGCRRSSSNSSMQAGPLPADGRRPGGQQFVPRPAAWEPGPGRAVRERRRTSARRGARSQSAGTAIRSRPAFPGARHSAVLVALRSERVEASRCCSPGGRWTCAPIAARSAFPADGLIQVRRRPMPRCARRTRRSGSIRRWSQSRASSNTSTRS